MLGGMGLPPVVAHLMGDISHFAGKMGEAEAITKVVTGSSSASWAAAGKAAMTVGGIMAVSAGVAAAASLHAAAGFDAEMERIHTMAGASQAEVGILGKQVLALAGATGQGPEKLAEALYHVESVGYRGAAAMSILNDAAKLSMISGAQLDATTYGLTSVMTTFGAKASESAHYAALFNATVGAGDMKMEAFNRAVGTGYYSAAQTFGVSAQSASAALAFMTDRGQHADEAATRLRMTLALLAAPSVKASQLLRAIGLGGAEVTARTKAMTEALAKSHLTTVSLAADLQKPDGLYVALNHLKTALLDSGLSAEAANSLLSHAFGGGKSDATILAMLNNLGTLKSKYEDVGKGMGKYGESVAKSAEQPAVQFAKLRASMDALGIEIGNVLMPYALAFGHWLLESVQWLTAHQGAVKALAMLIGVTLVAGLALATAGLIALVVAEWSLLWPILLIVAGVMALVAVIILVWQNWSTIWGFIVGLAKKVGGWLGQTWDAISSDAVQAWNSVGNWIKGVWRGIAAWFAQAWHTVTDPIVSAWNRVWSVTVSIWNAVSGFFRKWWPLLFVIFFPFIAVLVALWNHFHQQVFDTAKRVWNTVSTYAGKVWHAIAATAQFVWSLIYKNIVEPIQKAWHATSLLADRIRDAIVRGFNKVLAYVRAGWNVFYSIAIKPIVDFVKGVLHWMDEFGKAVNKAFDGALSWVRKHLSDWASIGVAIVKGVIGGIGSMAGWAGGQVSNFFEGMLANAKSFLGINSPSKLFADEVGKSIPEGIAVGVHAHAKFATGSVHALAADLVSQAQVVVKSGQPRVASQFTARGALGAPQRQVLEVHVHSTAEVDGERLFKVVQKKSLQYQTRNDRPAFAR